MLTKIVPQLGLEPLNAAVRQRVLSVTGNQADRAVDWIMEVRTTNRPHLQCSCGVEILNMEVCFIQNGDSVAAWMSAPDQTVSKASESPLQACARSQRNQSAATNSDALQVGTDIQTADGMRGHIVLVNGADLPARLPLTPNGRFAVAAPYALL